MKKIIVSVACLLATSLSFAGGNKTKEEDGVLANNFYLNIGMGMPTMQMTKYDGTSLTKSDVDPNDLGIQGNIEVGNQFYFADVSKFGFGLKASWVQIGIGSVKDYFKDIVGNGVNGFSYEAKLIKIAPMATYAINDNFGVDLSFEVAPTILGTQVDEISGRKDNVGTILYGVTFAPGLRVRYSMFSLGYDYSFGSLSGTGTLPNGVSDNKKMSYDVNNSRIYFGFNF